MIVIIDVTHSFHKSFFIFKASQPQYDLEKEKYKGILIRKAMTDLMATVNKLYQKPDEVYFCFDDHSWRKSVSKEYKADRDGKEPGFYYCLDHIYNSLLSNGFYAVKAENAEADDCIATICHSIKDCEKIIVSGDEDMHQLIDDETVVWNNNLKSPTIFLNKENEKVYLNIKKGYKKTIVDPKVSLFKKVMLGCSGDGVSALIDKKGVGEKTVEKVYKFIDFNPFVDYKMFEAIVKLKLKYERPDFIAKAQENLSLVDLSEESIPVNIFLNILDAMLAVRKLDTGDYKSVTTYDISSALKNSYYYGK